MLDAMPPSDPGTVWRLIERSDEAVKYARNADAYTRATAALDEAEAALVGLEPGVAGKLAELIRVRREDLSRLREDG